MFYIKELHEFSKVLRENGLRNTINQLDSSNMPNRMYFASLL